MPQNSNTFTGCLRIGRIGSEVCQEWLSAQPQTLAVIPLEGERKVFPFGVDMLWLLVRDGLLSTDKIEVKTDTWDTPNIFLEQISNEERGTPGWMETSQSDWLAYYRIPRAELTLYSFPDLKSWFAESPYRSGSHIRKIWNRSGNGGYHTVGSLCPEEVVRENVPHRIAHITTQEG